MAFLNHRRGSPASFSQVSKSLTDPHPPFGADRKTIPTTSLRTSSTTKRDTHANLPKYGILETPADGTKTPTTLSSESIPTALPEIDECAQRPVSPAPHSLEVDNLVLEDYAGSWQCKSTLEAYMFLSSRPQLDIAQVLVGPHCHMSTGYPGRTPCLDHGRSRL